MSERARELARTIWRGDGCDKSSSNPEDYINVWAERIEAALVDAERAAEDAALQGQRAHILKRLAEGDKIEFILGNLGRAVPYLERAVRAAEERMRERAARISERGETPHGACRSALSSNPNVTMLSVMVGHAEHCGIGKAAEIRALKPGVESEVLSLR